MSYKKKLSVVQDLLDTEMYGIETQRKILQKKLKGEINFKLMVFLVREKVYKTFCQLINNIKYDKPVDKLFGLLKKRINLHYSHLVKLKQPNSTCVNKMLYNFYDILKLITIERMSLKSVKH
tara:strand:+ start:162 stop:527 length:366 start_codon:yes stop_codon:yes gene_type:complete